MLNTILCYWAIFGSGFLSAAWMIRTSQCARCLGFEEA
jgi:hypothetical protein